MRIYRSISMSRNIFNVLAALAVLSSTPAFAAQDEVSATQAGAAGVTPKAGQVIRDTTGRRIGVVDSIRGSDVYIITNTKMVHVPVSTLTAGEKGVQTSLKSSDIR
jgi:hypothetical protein